MKSFNDLKRIPRRIRNFIYNQNLQKFLFITCISITAAILILSGCVAAFTIRYTVFHSVEDYYSSNHTQVRDRFFSASKEIRDFAERFAGDETLLKYTADYANADIIGRYDMFNKIKDFLNNAKVFYNDIYTIQVYFKNYRFQDYSDQILKTHADVVETELFKKVRDKQAVMLASIADKELELYTSSISFVSLMQDGAGNPIGIVVVIMKDDWLNKIFGTGNNVILYGNNLIWSSRNEFYRIVGEIGKALKYDYGAEDIDADSRQYRIYYTKTDYKDLYIISVMDYSSYVKQYNSALNWLFISLAIVAVLSFSLSKGLAHVITKPVYKLIKAMELYGITAKANMNDRVFDNRRSFRKGIILYYAAMISLSVLIFLSSFSIINQKITFDNIAKMSILSVNQAVNDLDYFIEMNERMSINLAYNDLVHGYLTKSGEINNIDIYNLKSEIDKFFITNGHVFDVNLYSMDGEVKFSTLLSLNTRLDNNVSEKIIGYKGKAYWEFLDKDLYNRNVITQTRLVMNIKPKEDIFELYKKVGFLKVAINEDTFEDFYRNLNRDGNNAFIADQNGIIVSHFSKQLIGMDSNFRPNNKDNYFRISDIGNGQKNLFIAYKSKRLPIYVIYEARLNGFLESLNNIIIPGALLFIGALIFSILFGGKVSYFIVYQFSVIQANIFSGNIEASEISSKSIHISEIKFMASTFNEMTKRINELIESVYVSEIKRKDLEMSVFQAQINPHFLCNTLETVSGFIDNNERENAKDVMILLRNLFSAWVHDYNMPIPIKEEIKYTQSYIEIQKRRFINMIKDEWLIDDDLIDCKIPRFLIQPVVENCIYHGNPERSKQLEINVYCFETDGIIILRIADNGDGMSGERLGEVRGYLNEGSGEGSIGLYNVNKRIKIFFGEKYGIKIESKLKKGTIVDIIFPKRDN